MQKVFVTGASGFIAKHILRELLDRGYAVRASVRSETKKSEIEALFPQASIEFAFLDLNSDDGWAEAMAGCDVLIHTASPFPLISPADPDILIKPAVDGTLRAMNAAKAAGIQRVVLTSSSAAIFKDASKPLDAPSDESNWTTADDASVSAYEASKTLAEKAAWDFVTANPEIELTTINPGMVLGPSMDANYGSSLELVEQLISGKIPMAPPTQMPSVDVRDVAMMHVAALSNDATKGERIAAAADCPQFFEIAKMLKDQDASYKTPSVEAPGWLVRVLGLFMPDAKSVVPNLDRNLTVIGTKAERLFGFTYIPVKDALAGSAQSVQKYS